MSRFLFPILMMLLPRFLPNIIKYVMLLWRLTVDRRVNIILRSLVPLALVYFIWPFDLIKDNIPLIGRMDDIIILAMAILFLVKACSAPRGGRAPGPGCARRPARGQGSVPGGGRQGPLP